MAVTPVGKQGTFPKSIDRRITEILPYRNPSTALGEFTAHGDHATIVASGGNFMFADSSGIVTQLNTNAVVNNAAYVHGERQYNRQKEPAFHCRFKLNSSSNVRMFIGLTSHSTPSDILASGVISSASVGGLYVDTASVSSFGSIRGSGGSLTKAFGVFGIGVDTVFHDFYMWMKRSGGLNHISMQLDDSDRVEYTTSIPSTTAIMRYLAGVANVANITKRLEVAKLSVNQVV